MSLMLEFLYNGDYNFPPGTTDAEWLSMHGKLFGYACKYGISGLKEHTAENFGKDKNGDQVDAHMIVDALREAYALALPGKDSEAFVGALFDANVEKMPLSDNEELRTLISESHVFSSALTTNLLDLFDPARLDFDLYWAFFTMYLKSGQWSCAECGGTLYFATLPEEAGLNIGCHGQIISGLNNQIIAHRPCSRLVKMKIVNMEE